MSVDDKGREPENDNESGTQDNKTKTFSSEYVAELRDDIAKHRIKSRKAEEAKDEIEKELKQLRDKIDSIDLDEVKKLREEKAEAERKAKEDEKARLLKEGEFDKLLEQKDSEFNSKLDEIVNNFQSQLDEIQKAKEEAEQKLAKQVAERRRSFVESEIVRAASKAEAIDPQDIQLRLEQMSKVVEADGVERVVLFSVDGEEIRAEDGKPITVESYVESMRQDIKTAHLFKGATSGAASKTAQDNPGDSDNPWIKVNLTKQIQMFRENPEKARRLAAAAGQKI